MYRMQVLSSHVQPISQKYSSFMHTYNLRHFSKTRKRQKAYVLVLGVKYFINMHI